MTSEMYQHLMSGGTIKRDASGIIIWKDPAGKVVKREDPVGKKMYQHLMKGGSISGRGGKITYHPTEKKQTFSSSKPATEGIVKIGGKYYTRVDLQIMRDIARGEYSHVRTAEQAVKGLETKVKNIESLVKQQLPTKAEQQKIDQLAKNLDQRARRLELMKGKPGYEQAYREYKQAYNQYDTARRSYNAKVEAARYNLETLKTAYSSYEKGYGQYEQAYNKYKGWYDRNEKYRVVAPSTHKTGSMGNIAEAAGIKLTEAGTHGEISGYGKNILEGRTPTQGIGIYRDKPPLDPGLRQRIDTTPLLTKPLFRKTQIAAQKYKEFLHQTLKHPETPRDTLFYVPGARTLLSATEGVAIAPASLAEFVTGGIAAGEYIVRHPKDFIPMAVAGTPLFVKGMEQSFREDPVRTSTELLTMFALTRGVTKTVKPPIMKAKVTVSDALGLSIKPEEAGIKFTESYTDPIAPNELISKFAGKEVTTIHTTTSDAFKVKPGKTILLEAQTEGAKGFRKQHDLLDFYKSLPTDEGIPQAYLGYVGIGKDISSSKPKITWENPDINLLVHQAEQITHIPRRPGETLLEYSHRTKAATGETFIPPENIFGMSRERQVTSPAHYDPELYPHLKDVTGTTIRKLEDVGTVWYRQETPTPDIIQKLHLQKLYEKLGYGTKYHKMKLSRWKTIKEGEAKPTKKLTPDLDITRAKRLKPSEYASQRSISISSHVKSMGVSSAALLSMAGKPSFISKEISEKPNRSRIPEYNLSELNLSLMSRRERYGFESRERSKISSPNRSRIPEYNLSEFASISEHERSPPYYLEEIEGLEEGGYAYSPPSMPPAYTSSPLLSYTSTTKPKKKTKTRKTPSKPRGISLDIEPYADWLSLTVTEGLLNPMSGKAKVRRPSSKKRAYMEKLTSMGPGLSFPTFEIEKAGIKTHLDELVGGDTL